MWKSSSSEWRAHLERYERAILELESDNRKNGLSDLESFVWKELPSRIGEREVPHLTSDEYSRLVRWKLKRGKWRPRLQSFADAVPDEDVIAASEKAFDAAEKGNVNSALKELVALKGCGPATASAAIASFSENFVFMSDELLVEALGERKYTAPVRYLYQYLRQRIVLSFSITDVFTTTFNSKFYMKLMNEVNGKLEELRKDDGDHTWNARKLEQAVFAAHHPPGDPGPEILSNRPSYADQALAGRRKKRTSESTVEEENSLPSSNTSTKRKSKNLEAKEPQAKRKRSQRSLEGEAIKSGTVKSIDETEKAKSSPSLKAVTRRTRSQTQRQKSGGTKK